MRSVLVVYYYIVSSIASVIIMVRAQEPFVQAQLQDPRWQPLVDVFRSNFADQLETAGASFAVYRNGKAIVNLWGGIANERIQQFWTEHSMSVLFSTTKSISATILAFILDTNNVSYDEKVATIWPEFARNGKENITIKEIALHQGGLMYSQQNVTPDDVADWKRMSKYFEEMTPLWSPGTKAGYHALTIGLLFDQIVRRVDKKHRGIVEILNEDFIEKFDIKDLSIGLPSKCANNRVAVLKELTDERQEWEGERNPEALRRYLLGWNDHNTNLYETWSWITTNDYNKVENRVLPMPSNMGIGNAKGLAHFHSLLAEETILSRKFYEQNLQRPVLENEMDVVNGYPESKGYGYQFTKNPKGEWVFGHSGFGGQNVRVDRHNHLSYAYVSNGLKVADADQVEPWNRLVEKLYELL